MHTQEGFALTPSPTFFLGCEHYMNELVHDKWYQLMQIWSSIFVFQVFTILPCFPSRVPLLKWQNEVIELKL
jgi:hypothetical protein